MRGATLVAAMFHRRTMMAARRRDLARTYIQQAVAPFVKK